MGQYRVAARLNLATSDGIAISGLSDPPCFR
jgi:hypothetical protein